MARVCKAVSMMTLRSHIAFRSHSFRALSMQESVYSVVPKPKYDHKRTEELTC